MMEQKRKARVIAFYLPQFHPIPENDKWWGKGFTEWTNVAKAKPLFRGHYQPRIPADLGFYDLRVPEVREAQAQLALEAGIEGFCYWHYWFGNGKQLLERPFNEVLTTGKPDFPFCLAWANHDWTTKTWQRSPNIVRPCVIAKQLYPGKEDYISHFNYVLPAFEDPRYIKVDGKPIFMIFDPYNFVDVSNFITLWRELAVAHGLQGIHFVAVANSTSTIRRKNDGTLERVLPNISSSSDVYVNILGLGFDAVCSFGKSRAEMISQGKYRRLINKGLRRYFSVLRTDNFNYPDVVKNFFAPEDGWENIYPTIMPQWDRSPRVGNYDGVYVNATPEHFKKHILDALRVVSGKSDEHKILFLRSWNEWGEGNYVEPDLKYGKAFLEVIKDVILHK